MEFFLSARLKVSVVTPPGRIGFGANTLSISGGEITVSVATAEPPGPLFSPQGKYRNCVRLMCAVRWDAGVDAALATLGSLASSAR